MGSPVPPAAAPHVTLSCLPFYEPFRVFFVLQHAIRRVMPSRGRVHFVRVLLDEESWNRLKGLVC